MNRRSFLKGSGAFLAGLIAPFQAVPVKNAGMAKPCDVVNSDAITAFIFKGNMIISNRTLQGVLRKDD